MFRRLSEQDHYQILEVDYSASAEEIQTAYENAREIYSNDSLVSSSILNAEERRHMLRRVKEAYNTLILDRRKGRHGTLALYLVGRHTNVCDASDRFRRRGCLAWMRDRHADALQPGVE